MRGVNSYFRCGCVLFRLKNYAKMSVFFVKTQEIRWWLGALPPDPLRRLVALPPKPRLCPPFAKSWVPTDLHCSSFLASLIFHRRCSIPNHKSLATQNETSNFIVNFTICEKFVVKAGAQNSFLPPGAGCPSYDTAYSSQWPKRHS